MVRQKMYPVNYAHAPQFYPASLASEWESDGITAPEALCLVGNIQGWFAKVLGPILGSPRQICGRLRLFWPLRALRPPPTCFQTEVLQILEGLCVLPPTLTMTELTQRLMAIFLEKADRVQPSEKQSGPLVSPSLWAMYLKYGSAKR